MDTDPHSVTRPEFMITVHKDFSMMYSELSLHRNKLMKRKKTIFTFPWTGKLPLCK